MHLLSDMEVKGVVSVSTRGGEEKVHEVGFVVLAIVAKLVTLVMGRFSSPQVPSSQAGD
jgi:hypothetical protein